MIIEQRFYRVRPHLLKQWLELWKRAALPVQLEHTRRHGGDFLGMYLTEVGQIDEVTHLWRHVDVARRMEARSGVESDPRWAEYRKEVDALAPMLAMRNTIFRPTEFSPVSIEPVMKNEDATKA
ncbi:NIPSNAP family protein [Paraburkholderia pallida]|uniref:NIPSNAP family protein n=1 Tax=Paraburkholderia pallida TaxID=2547399 RepID=A0A4P7D8X8_9BURK|nr:NIPSNAP family protein [Paraburkholderia pallida]QBR03650.1 NIPSNAP family protein [Paraburkholderia pallida]